MRKLLALSVIALLAVGCSDPITPETTQWVAVLQGTPAFPGVSGSAAVTSSGLQTATNASIEGATPGAVHPWHVHFGTCDNDQGIVGAAAAYPPFQVNNAGVATASANVAAGLQAGAQYFVNVHASPQDLATIVACGQLVMQ